MAKRQEEVWSNDYMSLYSNGTIGLSDGVGYLTTLSAEEVLELYKVLRKEVGKSEVGDHEETLRLLARANRTIVAVQLDRHGEFCDCAGCFDAKSIRSIVAVADAVAETKK